LAELIGVGDKPQAVSIPSFRGCTRSREEREGRILGWGLNLSTIFLGFRAKGSLSI
jgi:hypothetical protein